MPYKIKRFPEMSDKNYPERTKSKYGPTPKIKRVKAKPLIKHVSQENMPKKPFDPEGEDYDYDSAEKSGLGPDKTGHWPSREPKSGLLLKGRKHKTWRKTEAGEREAGYEIYNHNGRYYSKQKDIR